MTPVSMISALSRRMPASVRLAAFGVLAGLALGAAAVTSASANPGDDWRAGCQYKATPGGDGENIRYRNCIRQRDCELMANEMGHMAMGMGCFGVMPNYSPAPPISRRGN